MGINAIAHKLGDIRLSNTDLHERHPEWDMQVAAERTGVKARSHAGPKTTALDLAKHAVAEVITKADIPVSEIDGIICCTSMADFIFPGNSSCFMAILTCQRERLLLTLISHVPDFRLH